MSNVKARALMGASALVMAMGAAAAAQAQNAPASVAAEKATVAVSIYGGGSTLVQPYIRQAEDCFGAQAPTWDKSSPPVPSTAPYYNFTGANGAQDCSKVQADPMVTLQYQGTGSGGGILGFYTHNPKNLVSTGNYTVGTTGTFWPTLHYAASDLPLGANDVAVYNNGGKSIPTPAKSTDIYGSANTTGAIANPLAIYGPMVQYPILIAPVALAYSPIYKKTLGSDGTTVTTYSFHTATTTVNYAGSKITGFPLLKLDTATYCGILNGYITDWADPAIAATNSYIAKGGTAYGPAGTTLSKTKGIYVGGKFFANFSTVTSIEDPADPTLAAKFSVPIELAGRSDSSGTTGIFTRHLEAVCGAHLPTGETNKMVSGPTLPTALIATSTVYGPGSGVYTVQNGSGALATYVKFTAVPTSSTPTVVSGKIGYLGPDYVNPYSAKATGLYAAALQNNVDSTATANVYYLPSPKSALAAFGAVQPPQSNADGSGTYDASVTTHGLRSDPSAWVEPLAATSALAVAAEKTGGLTGAYAITGTSNVLAYTCYADTVGFDTNVTIGTGTSAVTTAHGSFNNVGVQLNNFLTWYNSAGVVVGASNATPGILAARGFADLPKAWKNAVKKTFLVPDTTTSGLKLWISPIASVFGDNTGTTAKPKYKTLFTANPICSATGTTITGA